MKWPISGDVGLEDPRSPKMSSMTREDELDLELIADLVIGVDRLARDIPRLLTTLRSAEGRGLARDLSKLSEALRLAISLELPTRHLAVDSIKLEQCFSRLLHLSVGTRVPGAAKVALELGVALSGQLASELGGR